ncbi:MAG TPA: L,D-transpeptidase, partial [Anaerolineales bacterium]|nr:L,D-transpeptidase [Anaerolineales bacterium]
MPDGLELSVPLSRREFVRLSATGLLALGVPSQWTRAAVEAEPGLLGRVVDPTLDIFSRPSFASEKRKTLWRDDVFEIAAAWIGDPIPEHNRTWYEANGLGFAHSASVQPVRDLPNLPLESIPFGGVLTEISVPHVNAHWRPRSDSELAYRFYYGMTFWVTGVSQDVSLQKWYRIFDDKYTYVYYAPAYAFRPIPVSELIPISSEIHPSEKLVEVDLAHQWVNCYEAGQLVFTTKVSTGRKFGQDLYATPAGEFETFRKRPSRHMAAGNLASGYDLPGVPWVAYIDEEGVSFHGTFWHNDFGVP